LKSPHVASLVFLHGLGDTGFGWAGALNQIKPEFLKVICPTAPNLPVTINGGAAMPAWYDILSLDEKDSRREDMEGVDRAVEYVHSLVQGEVESGVKASRVMVGGFSQGGAVALRAALTHHTRLAGCVALSCYLPGGEATLDQLGLSSPVETPVFQAHGDQDQVVSYNRGKITSQVLEALVKDHRLVTYQGMGHEGTMEELEDIQAFILQQLS